jgi:hypothetical protein
METKEENILKLKKLKEKYKLKNVDIATILGDSPGGINRKLRGERGITKTFLVCLKYAEVLRGLKGFFEALEG